MRSEPAPVQHRNEWARGWPVVCAGMIGIGTGAGLYQNVSSLFMPGMMADFGWSRGQISTAGGFGLVGGLAAPFIGRLADRVGVHSVIVAATLLIGSAYVGMACSHGGLWRFQVFVVCLAVGASGTNALVYGKLISNAFVRHRGLALGVVTSGLSLGTIAVPPILGGIIAARGWRMGLVALAALIVLVALPLVLLAIRRAPSLKVGRGYFDVKQPAPMGLTGAQARRTATFWRLAISVMLINMATIGLVTQLVPFGIDHGLSAPRAALLLASYGASQIVGRLAIGPLIDRIGAREVAACAAIVSAAGFALLELPGAGFVLLMTAVFVAGVMNGAEHDILPFLVTREFGLLAYGEICGTLLMLSLFGTAAGTIGFGRIHDATGSYSQALTLASLSMLAAAIIFAMLKGRSIEGRSETQPQRVVPALMQERPTSIEKTSSEAAVP